MTPTRPNTVPSIIRHEQPPDHHGYRPYRHHLPRSISRCLRIRNAPDVTSGRLDENANAGLEDLPIHGHTLPYVVKSPWLFEMIDELVARTDITLDAVIIPMRNIVEAAASRVILEMRARYGNEHLDPGIARWENWGQTPGGVVYSLNPIDQARILALGFHETVRALVQKNVPIIFLDFPRLVEDAAYLWSKLESILQHRIARQDAIAAHAKLADSAKVRAGKEINALQERAAIQHDEETIPANRIAYPSHETLDRAALLRELTRLRGGAARLSAEADQRRQDIHNLRVQLERAEHEASRARKEAEAAALALEEKLRNEYEEKLSTRQREALTRITMLEGMITALHASTSWRITQPLRTIRQWIRGKL